MKNFQNKIIRFSGLSFLFRELIQRRFVTIIFFHSWSVQTADMALKFLSKHYNIISLNEFINAHNKSDTKKLPPKSLIITIDDGIKENYELLPLLKKYAIPVTIFLTAGIIDTKRHYWFNFRHPKFNKSELKKKPNQERLNLLKNIGFEQKKEFEEQVALSKDQIDEMKEYVDFQSHTMFHPILPNCTDDEAKMEIINSKTVLENNYGLEISTLAFPNGDYSERDLMLVKQAGYKCSLITEPGFNSVDSNIFTLKRICVLENPKKSDLIVFASGIKIFAFNLKTIFNKTKRKKNLLENF